MFIPGVSSILTFSTQEQENIPEITMVDEEALIEARRRKREAILAKYQGQSTPSLVDNLKLQSAEASPAPGSPVKTTGDSLTKQSLMFQILLVQALETLRPILTQAMRRLLSSRRRRRTKIL